ncbi:MAG: hypothetical protein M1814_002102 [Vezdaea aestivalis]|nr:MAG: hypothetical protein M1814_002102 [Vezdaea aestivalis]
MSTYDNSNRAFLQALMARGTITYEESKPILSAILTANDKNGNLDFHKFKPCDTNFPGTGRETLPEDVTVADFNQYIQAADNAVQPYDMAVLNALSQRDSTRIYALVNITSDPITQLATVHSPEEISFLKRVLDAMFTQYNEGGQELMAITSLQALRHTNPVNSRNSTSGSVTKAQAETFLDGLVEEGWFLKSKAGFFSLSTRALIELEQWLLETYNPEDEGSEEVVKPIKFCYGCKRILTEGQRCADYDCTCRLHNKCTAGVFRLQKEAKICPLCKVDWSGKDFVGEKAARTSNLASSRRPTAARQSPSTTATRASPVKEKESGSREKIEDSDEDMYS